MQKIPKGILHTEEDDKHNQEDTGKNKSHEVSRLLLNEGQERSTHHKNKVTGNTTYISITTQMLMASILQSKGIDWWIGLKIKT